MKNICQLLLLSVMLSLIGCTMSGDINRNSAQEAAYAGRKYPKPDHIYIGEINVTTGVWGEDDPAKKAKLQADTKAIVEKELAEKISEAVPCSKHNGEINGWLIYGETIQVDEGDPVLRIAFGLGAGKSKAIFAMHIKNLQTSEIINEFTASGDSGAGIAEPDVVLGAGYVRTVKCNTAQNVSRMAREIRHLIKEMIVK